MSALRLPAGYRGAAELEVKRSRFLAILCRTDDEEQARAVVAEARHVHPEARHHCSAFVLSVDDAQPICRSNDDGEPAGTAGMPILEVLVRADLVDVTAVVVRWFGGIKLGTGGLARAYRDAVVAAVAAAPRVVRSEVPVWEVSLGHADAARLSDEIARRGGTVLDARHGADEATLRIALDDDAAALVARLSAGRGRAQAAGTVQVERTV